MAENNLKNILKVLHRTPCSQAELCEKLGLSKSHIHKLLSNLITPGIVEKVEDNEYTQEQGRPRQTLRIADSMQYCTVLVIHTTCEFRAYIYVYGHSHELGYIDLPKCDNVDDFINTLEVGIDHLTKSYFLKRELILSTVIATQATIEQGETGTMYRNNCLKDENVEFAKLISSKTKIRTFVFNFGYGYLLALHHNKDVNTDSAIVIQCGEGSVALGIFLDNKMQLGRNQSFPECSHLPYPYGFENSLGVFGEHSEDALFFAISVLAPIYNVSNVYIAGSAFEKHIDAIENVKAKLLENADPRLHILSVTYTGNGAGTYMKELIYLSFDTLVDVLDPQIIKRDLESMISQIKY